jgi:peptidoglycan hydrolase CwlO-like protein
MEKEMNEIDILKMNVNELQGQLQNAYKRIDQLQELIETERKSNEKTELIVDRDIQFITE